MIFVQLNLFTEHGRTQFDWFGNRTHTKFVCFVRLPNSIELNLRIDFVWVRFPNARLTLPRLIRAENNSPRIPTSFIAFAANLEHQKNVLSPRSYRCVFYDCSLMRQKRESDSEFMAFVHNQRGSHRPQLDSLLLKPVGILVFLFWPLISMLISKCIVLKGRLWFTSVDGRWCNIERRFSHKRSTFSM